MRNSPKFSILIAAYNAVDYIEECLRSITEQAYKNYEIIVIDDGSNDGTEKLLIEWEKRFDYIYVHRWNNQGLIASRRKAIALAKGEYILFIDADDFYVGESLMTLAEELTKSQVDILLFRFKFIGKGTILKESTNFAPRVYSGNEDKIQLFEDLLRNYEYNHMCCKAIKRQLLIQDKTDYSIYFRLQLGEDLLQTVPIFMNGTTVKIISQVLYGYRILENSMSHNFKIKQILDINQVYLSIWETINSNKSLGNAIYKTLREAYLIKMASLLRILWEGHKPLSYKINVTKRVQSFQMYKEAYRYRGVLVKQNRLLIFLLEKKWWQLANIYGWIISKVKEVKLCGVSLARSKNFLE